jgi:hypothetical protein
MSVFGAVLLAVIAAEPTAAEIATRALENNTFSASNARATIELEVLKEGKVVRSRRIVTKIKRSDGQVKSFVEFVSPADVAGTKFLSVEKRGEDADQFIYLPAFKKVKRVVGAQRATSFMGTDFSYADLDGRDVDDAEWKRQADEALSGQDCFVIEGTSKNPGADAYGRTLIWVHKQHMLPMRIDFFDRDKATVKKRLVVKKLEKKNERWIASDSTMATVAKGTETHLRLASVDFETPIPDDDFSQRALER